MTTLLQLLLAVLLCRLGAAAPAAPADKTNVASRRQVATSFLAASAFRDAGVDDTTSQALVCSQILDVLPSNTFHRQRFDSFTTCRCVSPLRATCEPDTMYPTVAPGTAAAALATEHSFSASPQYLALLNAFSVQQMCFFEHLRGRTCAFSWERGGRPACDCVKQAEAPAEAEATLTEVAGDREPALLDSKPAPGQSKKDAERAKAEAAKANSTVVSTTSAASVTTSGRRSASGMQARRATVAESAHLRRVRSAPRL